MVDRISTEAIKSRYQIVAFLLIRSTLFLERLSLAFDIFSYALGASGELLEQYWMPIFWNPVTVAWLGLWTAFLRLITTVLRTTVIPLGFPMFL